MKRMWGVIAVVIAVTGCAKDDTADQAAIDSAAAPAATPATPAISDAEIAHIASTANLLDAEAGEVAKTKATNTEVKQFAQTMITDHNAVNKEALDLAAKLGVTPADNPTSQQLKSDGDAAKADLSAKTGADFDKAYIAREITYHQNVLNALDQTLIPNAQNAELKALLEKVRPVIDNHLKMAQAIQAKIGT
jgi:putative membrane protein